MTLALALIVITLAVVAAAGVVAVRSQRRAEAVRGDWCGCPVCAAALEAGAARLSALFNDTDPKGDR